MTAVARNAKNLPPLAATAGAPDELDAIIAKLTAFDRDARYASARGAVGDLARLLTTVAPLPGGERGVRARVGHLMTTLFPGEPGRTRREFARLVASARTTCGDRIAAPRLPPPLPPPVPDLPPPAGPGDVLGGTRYRLIREIGHGASSVVYEAEHLDLGKRVAIKIIDLAKVGSPGLPARFRREARTLSRLSHAGLVAVHDVGQASDGRLFCVMELLEGETLEHMLARVRCVGFREALDLGLRVLAALEVAHGAALVHRDIKPANLFLPRGGAGLKLLDFGLARGTDDPEGTTQPGTDKREGFALFGTPEYMAPEQAAGSAVDARADLYALGCVLYEMLTGQLPFAGASSVAILDAKIKGSPERPRGRAPAREIPEAVDALVTKALARHPSQRFQTATEMRLAVEAVLAAPARRGRSRLAAAAAFALIGALGLTAAASRNPKIRVAAASLYRPQTAAVTAAAPPAATAVPAATAPVATAPAPAEAVAAAADAKAGEDGFDEGEDGDFVDDTLPGTLDAEGSAVAEAPPAPAEKPHRRKHGAHAEKGGGKAAPAGAKVDDDATKTDRTRRKHKPKVARVQ
jgi:serine/threonine-protein kinase